MTIISSVLSGWLILMSPQYSSDAGPVTPLPAPRLVGEQSLEGVLNARRSIREYRDAPLSLEELSQLLWSAQGITGTDGRRTAPSAGALYPLEVYVVVGRVASLDPGVYHYRPDGHSIALHSTGDVRPTVARAALGQECVRDGAVVLVFAGVYARTEKKYHERAERYVHMEAGHAAQNVCLQATALGLGAVTAGAFDDAAVHETLGLPSAEKVLYLVPVGRPE